MIRREQVTCKIIKESAGDENISIIFLGTIDFNDFLSLMAQKMAEKDTKEEILKAFK